MRYHIWLKETAHLSCDKACRLISEFGSAEAVYNLSESALHQEIYLNAKDIVALSCKELEKADQIINNCKRRGIEIITFSDKKYPNRLREIHHPPLVLYAVGNMPEIDRLPAFGIVGSRSPDMNSSAFAKKMSGELTQAGMLIVSGMAKGIDAEAAYGALEYGPTVAVLGTAIDNVYPKNHTDLYRKISQKGVVLSEYPPGARTYATSFIERNRIIAGLSIGVLVVQAGEKSGSLKTARYAEEYGRYVFVSPGLPMSEKWAGSNELLRSGAFYTVCCDDVLSQFESAYAFKKPQKEQGKKADIQIPSSLSKTEAAIYKSLDVPKEADEIAQLCNLQASVLSPILTVMEISGYIEQMGNGAYRRK